MIKKGTLSRANTPLSYAVVTVWLLAPSAALTRDVQSGRRSEESQRCGNGSPGIEEAKQKTDNPESIEELRQRVEEIERTTRAQIEELRHLLLKQAAELASLRQQPPTPQASPQTITEKPPVPGLGDNLLQKTGVKDKLLPCKSRSE